MSNEFDTFPWDGLPFAEVAEPRAVETYSDLPDASDWQGRLFAVKTAQGKGTLDYHPRGAYYSDGEFWNYIGPLAVVLASGEGVTDIEELQASGDYVEDGDFSSDGVMLRTGAGTYSTVAGTGNAVPKWSGSTLVNSNITDDGSTVVIGGSTLKASALSNGIIRTINSDGSFDAITGTDNTLAKWSGSYLDDSIISDDGSAVTITGTFAVTGAVELGDLSDGLIIAYSGDGSLTTISGTNNTISKWNGTSLVDSSITDDGSDVNIAVNLIIGGNLAVNGTTTTIDTTTLVVEDKNIELGNVDTPSDATADGGGITLLGSTNKTIIWDNATDTWQFNQGIEITFGNIQASQLVSDIAVGTAPLSVTSTTVVTNLNADLLDGQEGGYYLGDDDFSSSGIMLRTAAGTYSTVSGTSNTLTKFSGDTLVDSNITDAGSTISFFGGNTTIDSGGDLAAAAGLFSDTLTISSGGASIVGDLVDGGGFSSGFGGSGWKLDDTDDALTLDHLTVRGTLSVYELLIQQIRASNGNLWVSDALKVTDVSGSGPYVLTYDEETPIPFLNGDILLAQRFTGTGTYQTALIVTEYNTSSTTFTATKESGNSPTAGMEFVRVGNTSDTDRQGAVYLSASDDGAPFIDVYDDVSSWSEFGEYLPKSRLGKLTGITDTIFGTLEGYGLYSQTAYLTGNAQIAGTLTAGDADGVGSTFYAGLMRGNLLRNSQNMIDAYYGGTTDSQTEETGELPNGETGSFLRLVTDADNQYAIFSPTDMATVDLDGKTVVYSVYLKGTAGATCKLRFVHGGTSYFLSDDITLTATWALHYITGVKTADTEIWATRIANISNGGSPATVDVWGMQVRLGSTPTMFQPTDNTILPEGSGYGMWAAAGGFGGTIQNPVISLGDFGFTVENAGTAHSLANGEIAVGNITGTANSAIKITNTGTTATSGVFAYDNSGNEVLALQLDGTHTLSGFTIGQHTLATTGAGVGDSSQDYAFWAGSDTPASAEFRVAHDGTLVASSATITGEITADSGSIGGWNIDDPDLVANGGTIMTDVSPNERIIIDGASNQIQFESSIAGSGARITVGSDVHGTGLHGYKSYNAQIQAQGGGTDDFLGIIYGIRYIYNTSGMSAPYDYSAVRGRITNILEVDTVDSFSGVSGSYDLASEYDLTFEEYISTTISSDIAGVLGSMDILAPDTGYTLTLSAKVAAVYGRLTVDTSNGGTISGDYYSGYFEGAPVYIDDDLEVTGLIGGDINPDLASRVSPYSCDATTTHITCPEDESFYLGYWGGPLGGAGSLYFDLPDADNMKGRILIFKTKGNTGSSGNVYLDPDAQVGSQTLDGSTSTVTIGTATTNLRAIISDGDDWFTLFSV